MNNNPNVNNVNQPYLNNPNAVPNNMSTINNNPNVANNGQQITSNNVPPVAPVPEQNVNPMASLTQATPETNMNNGQVAMTSAENNNNNNSANYLNEMNVNGSYNHMEAPPSYVNDPSITDNIKVINGQKKITVPISKELKTVIIISLILFAFIIILPMLGDLINAIRFR